MRSSSSVSRGSHMASVRWQLGSSTRLSTPVIGTPSFQYLPILMDFGGPP